MQFLWGQMAAHANFHRGANVRGSICPYTIKDLSDLEIVQWDLFSACDWSGDWLLRFNVLKFKYTQHGNVKFEHKYQMRDAKELLLLCPKTHKNKRFAHDISRQFKI